METEAGVILPGSLFEEKREPCDQAPDREGPEPLGGRGRGRPYVSVGGTEASGA